MNSSQSSRMGRGFWFMVRALKQSLKIWSQFLLCLAIMMAPPAQGVVATAPNVVFVATDGVTPLTIPGAKINSDYILGVKVTDSVGAALSSQTVTWKVASTGTLAGSLANVGIETTTQTDGNGYAQVTYTSGTKVGKNSLTAKVTVGGKTKIARFMFSTISGPEGGTQLVCSSTTNNQAGVPGTALKKSFSVQVKDTYGNLVTGALINWLVTVGNGSFSVEQSATTGTKPAATTLFTPAASSSTTYRVTATLDGTSITCPVVAAPKPQFFSGKLAPPPPTGLSAQRSGTSVTLSWSADTSGGPAVKYSVFRSATSRPAGGSGWQTLKSGITGTSYVDTKATSLSTTYYYYVSGSHIGGSSNSISVPSETIVLPEALASTVSMTYWTTCALNSSGVKYCWGANHYLQFGNGASTSTTSPVNTNTGLAALSPPVAAQYFSRIGNTMEVGCGITLSGNLLKCWGIDVEGRLGDGATETGSAVPVTIDSGTPYAYFSGGSYWNCAVTTAGVLKCWGPNDFGQQGLGPSFVHVTQTSPTVVDSGVTYSMVSAGGSFPTCALTTAGKIKCFGTAAIGNGAPSDLFPTPIVIDGNTNYKHVTAGGAHMCGLTTLGKVRCWGGNANGQVGNGTITDQLSPVDVDASTDYIDVSAFSAHTCGITTAGVLKCWGANSVGQVGDGTTIDRSSPVVVDSGVTYVSLGRGGYAAHACALTTAGTLKCWGNNDNGQVGNGSTDPQLTPVQINLGS